jgi:tetratricopeptide (TPR) repeat protein
MSSPPAATGTRPADSLGLTLALDGERAFVSCQDRWLTAGVLLESLELELTEVDFPLDLDGDARVFRNRATRLRSAVLRLSADDLGHRLRQALWSQDVPLTDVRVVGEGGHLVVEGRYGRRRAPMVYHVAVAPDEGPSLKLLFGPLLPFDVPEPPTATLLERLGHGLARSVSLGDDAPWVERTGPSSFRMEPLRPVLRTLLVGQGWKTPLVEGVGLTAVDFEGDRLRLRFGSADAATTSHAARRAIAWEAEAAEMDIDLLLVRGRFPEAFRALVTRYPDGRLPDGLRHRALEIALGDPVLHDAALQLANRENVVDLLVSAVINQDRHDETQARAGFDRAAGLLRSAGHQRAAGWALLPTIRSFELERRVARLEDAVALRPDDAEILGELVDALPRLGRTQAAVRAARRLARVAPEPAAQVEALLAAGRLLRDDVDDPIGARKAFEAALQLVPDDETVMEELALAFGREGRLAPAIELVEGLIRRARDAGDGRRTSRLQVQAGRLWAEHGEPRRAVDHFRTAYDYDPGNLDALVGYFEQAAAAEVAASARTFWNGIESGLPDHGPQVAQVFLAAGRLFLPHDRNLGRQVLARARRADPEGKALFEAFLELEDDPEALPWATWVEGANTRLATGQDDEAFRILFMLAERGTPSPHEPLPLGRWVEETVDPERLRRLALVAERFDDPTTVESALRRAIVHAEAGPRASLRARLAEWWVGRGRVRDATRELSDPSVAAAVAADVAEGTASSATQALALHQAVRHGRWDEALAIGSRIRGRLRDLPPAGRTQLATDLGRAYAATHQPAEHASVLREALAAEDPDSASARRLRGLLADAYRMQGDREGLAELRRQMAARPETPPAERALLLMEAARTARAAGEERQALEDAEAALEAARQTSADLEHRATRLVTEILEDRGVTPDGDQQAERAAVEAGSVRERLILERAALLEVEGRIDDAERTLAEGCADVKASHRVPAALGMLLARRGDAARAAEAYGQASRRADRAGQPDAGVEHAARAGELYAEAGDPRMSAHYDRAALSLAGRGAPDVDLEPSLQRLEASAREAMDHEALVDLLQRQADRATGPDAVRRRFEAAQILALALQRKAEAVQILRSLPLEGDLGRSILECWQAWADEDVAGPPWQAYDSLVGSIRTVEGRTWAWLRAAERLLRTPEGRPAALARLEAVVRLDPDHEEARRLRQSLLVETRDPVQRAEALAEEAGRAARPGPLWLAAGRAFLEAAAEDREPDYRERACAALEQALSSGDDEVSVGIARAALTEFPPLALRALGQVERSAADGEVLWACRIMRARAALAMGPDDAALHRIERAWELLDQLDARLLDQHLARLGGAPERDGSAREQLLSLGSEAAALAGPDGAQEVLRWSERRAESIDDDVLRSVARIGAAEWIASHRQPELTELAAEHLASGLDWTALPSPLRHRAAWVMVIGGRTEDAVDHLGLIPARALFVTAASPIRRRIGAALARRLPRGSDAWSHLLFELADEVEEAERTQLLRAVARHGDGPAARTALQRLETWSVEAGDDEALVDIQRQRADAEPDDVERARLRAQLGETYELRLGDSRRAEAEYRAALAIDPECGTAAEGLRRLWVSEDRFREVGEELGAEVLDEVRRGLLSQHSVDRSTLATEVWAQLRPEAGAEAWLQLAQTLDERDDRRVSFLARAAREDAKAGSAIGERALNELWHLYRTTEDARRRVQLAELLSGLVDGPERAELLMVRMEAEPESTALLEEAYALDPDHPEIRDRLIALWVRHRRYDDLVRMLGSDGVEPLLAQLEAQGESQQVELLLEARARSGGAARASADWLLAAQGAYRRQDLEAAWRRLERAIEHPPLPPGADVLLGNLVTEAPEHAPASGIDPDGIRSVLDQLGGRELSDAGWSFLAWSALRGGGVDGVGRVADGDPERSRRLGDALAHDLHPNDPGLYIDVRLALARLRPADPQLERWLEEAFDLAEQSHRDRLAEVGPVWMEVQLSRPDPQHRRRAIDRARAVDAGLDGPELMLASLLVELELGHLVKARREADVLFDSDVAPAEIRREAAEAIVHVFGDARDADALAGLERAWVELCRPETVSETERIVGLRALADVRESRGADPSEVAQPLEAVVGLGMLEAEEIEVRRKLRELWEQAGDWARAEQHQTALADMTRAAEDLVLLAELRTWLSDLDGARDAVVAALEADPSSEAAYGVRLRLAEHTEDWTAAIDALLGWGAYAADPEDHVRRLVRAVQTTAEHRPPDLKGTAERALTMVREDRVEVFLRRMRPIVAPLGEVEVDELLSLALQRWPESAGSGHVRVALAQRLAQRNDPERARAVLLSGLTPRVDPEHPLVDAVQRLCPDGVPRPQLEALAGSPVGSSFARRAAERAEQEGRIDEAIEMWRLVSLDAARSDEAQHRLDELTPRLPPGRAHTDEAEAALADGAPERALHIVQTSGLGGTPVHLRTLAALGQWSELADRLSQQAAATEGPTRVQALSALARVAWERLGAFHRAASAVTEAAEEQAGFRMARMATDLDVMAGLTDEAVRLGAAVLAGLAPDDERRASAVLGLAGAHLARASQEEAERILDAGPPSDPVVRLQTRLRLAEERWADADRALMRVHEPEDPDDGPVAAGARFERWAARLWMAHELLGDEKVVAEAVEQLERTPVVEPPLPLRFPWVLPVAHRLARSWPRGAAALVDGLRRLTGEGPDPLLAELWFTDGRDQELITVLADAQPRERILPWLARAAVRAGRPNGPDAWAECLRVSAADPTCDAEQRSVVLREWAVHQPPPLRKAALRNADWLWPSREEPEDAPDIATLERDGRWSDARTVLQRVFEDPSMPEEDRRRALERWVALSDVEGPAALSVLQQAAAYAGPILPDLLLHTAALARRLQLREAELDAVRHLADMASEHEQCDHWLRMVVLLEDVDPGRAAERLRHVIDREGPQPVRLRRLARLYRKDRRPREEAALWARFGTEDPVSLSRVAVLRARELDDRRGARAAWRAAIRRAPEELSFRWGLIQQNDALGAWVDARDEAEEASRVARRLRAEAAAAALALEALRFQAHIATDPERELRMWDETYTRYGHHVVVLDAAVARSRQGGPAEAMADRLQARADALEAGSTRGRMRVAAARMLERDLGVTDRASELRRRAATEDFPENSREALRDAPGHTLPPLDTMDLGVSRSHLELSGRLDELVNREEQRAALAEDPYVKSQIWIEVARYHGARREPDALVYVRRALGRAVQAHPLSVDAWAELALAEIAAEDWTGAQRSLERLRVLGGPPWPLGDLELRAAKVAHMLGDAEQSRAWLARARTVDPHSLGALRGAVETADEGPMRLQALTALKNALDPVLDGDERARLDLEIARSKLASGAFEEATAAIDEALRLKPELTGARTVRAMVLQAASAPEGDVRRAQVDAALFEREPDLAQGLEAALALDDDLAITRIADRLDDSPDELVMQRLAQHWRRREAWHRFVPVMDRLGGLDAVDAPTPVELAGWIRHLADVGRVADVFRQVAGAPDPDRVLEALQPAESTHVEARFWLAQLVGRLDRQTRADPRVQRGLDVLHARFEDHAIMRALAESERSAGDVDRARTLYRPLVARTPWDLQLLEAWTDLAPDPAGVRWVRSFLTHGVARPTEGGPIARSLWEWAAGDGADTEREAYERRIAHDETVDERDAVALFTLDTEEFGEVPIVRHIDPEADVVVELGRHPCVWVPWACFVDESAEAVRFLAARELAYAVVGDRSVADRWALQLVPDLRAAVDVIGRWGLGRVFVPLDDPRARTHTLRTVPPLTNLVRSLVGVEPSLPSESR